MPRFAAPEVHRAPLEGGGFVLRVPTPLGECPRRVGDKLAHWAKVAGDRPFLVERGDDGAWRRTSYADAFAAARSLGQVLLDLGLGPTRPLMLLSGNSVDHALLQLAGMHVGIPVAPVSPAYSLLSADFAKLRTIAADLAPGAVYVDDGAAFAKALGALGLDVPILVSRRGDALSAAHVLIVNDARSTSPTADVDEAFDATGPDTVAKILFTSGSTGAPKGVVNTQRMLSTNQEAIAAGWPFLAERPPIVVDWLPWSHTFGGNHNFFLVLWHGGTLYVDAGKPAPGAFETTLRNLREISPTLYFNVPRGFDMLATQLENDAALRDTFFAELDLVFYAAAALPQSTWARIEEVSRRARGEVVAMVSAWGSTETSPLATQVHFSIPRAGVIGLPARGTELAFVPSGSKLEMRVKGPNVSPGYWRAGGRVEPLALDEGGFFPMGDAGRLEDDADPTKGVVFDGRTAENFKLASGTWVHVGELRIQLVAACAPLVADAVVTGHDREEIGALFFVTPDAAKRPDLDVELTSRLLAFNAGRAGTSTRVARALVLDEAPSIDAGEITDKGYLNQRAVLERRADEVARLYDFAPGRVHVRKRP